MLRLKLVSTEPLNSMDWEDYLNRELQNMGPAANPVFTQLTNVQPLPVEQQQQFYQAQQQFQGFSQQEQQQQYTTFQPPVQHFQPPVQSFQPYPTQIQQQPYYSQDVTTAAPAQAAPPVQPPASQETQQPVCFFRFQPLKHPEAMALLLEDGNYVTKMPLKATSGTIWRFKSNSLWCWSDQEYLWVEPGGSKVLMKGELQKRIFHIKTPDTDPKRGSKGFQMFVWETKQRPGIALVHLVGDAALSVDMPHGNSKSSQPRAHHRTAKSTMLEMKTVSEKPSAYYRRKRGQVASDPASQVLLAPKNTNQVRNTMKNVRRRNGQQDSSLLLQVYANDFPDNRFLMTNPDLVMVNSLPMMLDHVKALLKGYDYDKSEMKILLGYDTQFTLTDGYVSWVTISDNRFTHITSGAAMILPVFQIIHERKLSLHHKLAWMTIIDELPALANITFVAVSDDEFTELLTDSLKKAYVVKCENHGSNKIKFWVKTHGGTKDDADVYSTDFRWLIRADSQEHYNIRLINTVQRWSPAFQQYYMTNINTDVHLYSDWLAKKIKFPTTKDSIFTSNGCEHINFMVKFLQDFKEVPLHHMFHLGRDLAKGKLQEIAAAYVGTGDYKLLPKYQAKRRHVDQAKSQKMLEKLGEVPFYKDILTRLKAGEDISAYREAKADDSAEEALEDQEVHVVEVQGANEPREVQKAQGEVDQHETVGLETIHNALKRMSVSPANSPAASPVKSNEKYLEDNLEDIEKSLEAVEKSLEASQLEEALLSEWHVAGPVTITISPPSLLPSPSSSPTASSTMSAMASPSIPSMASLAESAIASTAESAIASTAPSMASPAKSAVASPTVSAVASPEALSVASPAAPSPAASSIDSSAMSTVASPAVSAVASPATLSVASSSVLHMYAGLSASLTRLPGSEIFVLPGRTTSFTVEPKKGFCGQCGVQKNTDRWCPHLVAAGQAMGMTLAPRAPYIRSLTKLRKNQRPDRNSGKSGKKAPRPGDLRTFSLLPVYDVNSEQELEDIEIKTASNLNSDPSANHLCSHGGKCIDETIEEVINVSKIQMQALEKKTCENENTKEKKNQNQEDEVEDLDSDVEEEFAEEDLSILLAAALNKKKRRESLKLILSESDEDDVFQPSSPNLPSPKKPQQSLKRKRGKSPFTPHLTRSRAQTKSLIE